jgi:ubiquitin-conjugating enzyme E2 O
VQDHRSLFKEARWLKGYWNHGRSRLSGTVLKVETSGVLVYWIASMYCGMDKAVVEASAPPAYQQTDDLTFFCAGSDFSWGVADQCFLREPSSAKIDDDNGDVQDQEKEGEEEDEDEPCSENNQDVNQEARIAHPVPPTKQKPNDVYRKQLSKVFFEGHRRKRRPHVRRHVEVEFPMIVASTSTSVDVLWQDGTLQHGIPSATLVPFDMLNEQEFFPGQQVVENPFDTADDTNGDHDGATRCVGIVTSLDCKEQTAYVSWFKAGMPPHEAREVDCIDTVSAYDLKLNHSPHYGDIVVRPVQSGSMVDGGSATLRGKKKKNAADQTDLSWVGHVNVVNLPNGHIQVKWGDGSMSTVRGYFSLLTTYNLVFIQTLLN